VDIKSRRSHLSVSGSVGQIGSQTGMLSKIEVKIENRKLKFKNWKYKNKKIRKIEIVD
jgi:hypothetical protein